MYLVDTNILSESTRHAPDQRIVNWLLRNEPSVHVSVISIGEIHYGIELLANGGEKTKLREWLRELRETFAESIVPMDDSVALCWGALKADLDRRGRKIPAIDSILAATALAHDLTLVTANTKDFIGVGVKLLDPH